NNFVDSNGINVTTVGIGDGINTARLQDIDVDGAGAPIAINDFNDLIDALQQVTGGDTSGNVITDGVIADAFGADGGRILSIQIGGTTYTWNGTNGADAIDPGTPLNNADNLDGNTLSNIATPNGGHLSFNFATGAWTYTAPTNLGADLVENFTYTLRDND